MAASSWASSAPPSLVWSPPTTSDAYNYRALEAGHTHSDTFTLENSGGKASGARTIRVGGRVGKTLRKHTSI
jgi:hypothetical protein